MKQNYVIYLVNLLILLNTIYFCLKLINLTIYHQNSITDMLINNDQNLFFNNFNKGEHGLLRNK